MIISFINSKGGTGKSTLCTAVAHELAKTKRVLMIDTDPNCSLSVIHGVYVGRSESVDDTAYSLFDGRNSFVRAISKNLAIIPSHVKMSAHGNTSERTLSRTIKTHSLDIIYDYILLDAPGYKNNIFRSCINASDVIIIPSKVSLQDADQTAECLEEIQNQDFTGKVGIVINDIDKKTTREDEIYALFGNMWGAVLSSRIPHMRGLFRIATEQQYTLSGAGKNIIANLVKEITE
jgi:cellulose biosynthesis protein BcsQ